MTKKDIRNKIKSELLLRDSNLKKFAKEKFNISYDGFMKKLNGSTKLSFKDVFVLVKSTSSKILDEVFEVLEQDRVVEEVAQAIEKQCIESSFMAQDLKLSEDQIKLLKQNLAKIFFTIMTKKKNDFLNDLKKELNKNGQDGVKIEDTFIFRIKQILAKTLSNTLDIIGEQFKREYSFQSTVDKVERIVDNKTGQNIGFRYQAVHYGKAVLAPNANLIVSQPTLQIVLKKEL